MKPLVPLIAILNLTCFGILPTAFAQTAHLQPAALADIDFSFLSCFTQSTPSATIQLAPSDAQRISIGIGSRYYTDPKCFHHIVQFIVPSNAGTALPTTFPYYTQHSVFSFDSLVNELINTPTKCSTYSQQTILFRKQGSGSWTNVGYTRFRGAWMNDKCKIKLVAGQSDFRTQTFNPRWNGTDYYRVASRVTTGSGSSQVARGVCVGLRFADIQDVPQRSCAMPE